METMNSNKENKLKDLISLRVLEAIKKLQAKGHARIGIKNFEEIKENQIGSLFVFSHPLYNKKDLEYLNEEGEADFLLFENNGVYINYEEEMFNFHKIDEEEKLVHIDLDNQEILEKDEGEAGSEMDTEGLNELSEEITKKNDMITLNYFPISVTHSNLTINFDQNFPQVLSDEFILQALQIFSIAQNSSLRCGYNSLGAGCIINHLHFEIIFLDDFNSGKNSAVNVLPIEKSQKTKIFSTKLVNKNPEDISLFDENVEVTLSFVTYPLPAWKIESWEIVNQPDSNGSYQNSLANCVNGILNDLISAEIPHNLIISDGGHTIYIIPRKFVQNPLPINTCWNDLSGLVTLKEVEEEDSVPQTEENLLMLINSVALTQDEFNSFTQNIVTKFDSLYFVDIMEFDFDNMKIEN